MRRLSERIDTANRILGEALSWLTSLMVLVTFVIVVLRYAFDTGWIWLQESVTWMHALVFMLAAAYTLGRDEHVRVDIFYQREMHWSRTMAKATVVDKPFWFPPRRGATPPGPY